LLVAGLTLMAHNIIPHDHHITGTDNGERESCPASEERQHHHPLFPAHCHAFNDLAAEKFTPVVAKYDTGNSFAAVIWLPEAIIHRICLIQTSLYTFPVTIQEIQIPESSHLRAPPSIS
jgi:hypothetical protein